MRTPPSWTRFLSLARVKSNSEVHNDMKAAKAQINSQRRLTLIRLPVIALLILFVMGYSLLAPPARLAPSAATKGTVGGGMSRRYLTAPPAPVRLTRPLADEFEIETGSSFRCGGANCQHNDLVCTTAGTYIVAVTGCCAQCCWNGTENCSSINCCSPL
jgi:hypothetical protein